MTPSGNAKLSHLLAVLHSGEALAANVAQRQSRIAPLPWMSRALAVQAAQERGHTVMAAAALRLTGTPRHAPDVMLALRRRIDRDLAGGSLAASVLGLQGVIEHLGEALLETLGHHKHPVGAVLHGLRKKVLAQERGHVQLGARCLQALDPEHRHTDALAGYRAAGRATALHTAALLDDARLDASAFWNRVDARLNHWHAPTH